MGLTFQQEQAFNKDLYLLGRVALQTGLLNEELPLDEAFEFVVNLYQEFYTSDFNDLSKSSYACILEFITYKIEAD